MCAMLFLVPFAYTSGGILIHTICRDRVCISAFPHLYPYIMFDPHFIRA
jgi:hypothetical protein